MQGDISRLSRSLTHLSSHWYAFSSFFPSPTPSPKKDAAGHRRCSTSIDYSLVPDSLCLSVLKLDGSSFDVQITGDACVEELKVAIEESFTQASAAEGGSDNISWLHVWGHFCLCFDDHMLTDDKASLRTFGIKDGDQLRFIRHLSLNQVPRTRRTQSCVADLEMDMNAEDDTEDTKSPSWREVLQLSKNGDSPKYTPLADDLVVRKRLNFGCLFQRWISYSRRGSPRKM